VNAAPTTVHDQRQISAHEPNKIGGVGQWQDLAAPKLGADLGRSGMISAVSESKKRFLVLHDYGMGGLWWWIYARSARQIVEAFAEVEVIEDPQILAKYADDNLTEVDIDASVMPAGLDGLRDQRNAQRRQPGFGALAERGVVYLRRPWDVADDTEPFVYLEELGGDGRRTRQVEVYRDGTAIKTGPDDWPFNPPIDLHDPEPAQWEIDQGEFEQAWQRARRES
jgi:hypothetical protein